MSSSEKFIELITNSVDDDATISAALDALREDRGFDLLDAVMAVAAARRAGVDAREVAAALKLIEKGSPIRSAMLAALKAECSEIEDEAKVTVEVVPGDQWPEGYDTSLLFIDGGYIAGNITVGAQWILSRAPTIRHNLAARRPRRRRSKKK